jgi:2-hydroxychromene-2-carboxylate isomerase
MTEAAGRLYFSFRSPYSWIAERLIEERYGFLQDQLQYIPYWEPDAETAQRLEEKKSKFLYRPMSREKHLYILKDIKRQVAKHGYRIAWPVDRNPWWERPHLAYLVAERTGKAALFRRLVYRARFEQGRDVCSVPVLEDVARDAGLDPAELLAAPDDAQLRDAGAEGLRRADRDGIFGVPFIALRHDRFWGIDRLHDVVEAVSAQGAELV